MPKNGFQINKLAYKLITKQPEEVSSGKEADKLKQNLRDLENLVEKLISEMDNYYMINQSKQRANELIGIVNDSIQQTNAYLRQLTLNHKETIVCCENIEKLKELLKNGREKINNSIFRNQIMKLKANSTSIYTKDFSVLIFFCLIFTKIN